MPRRRHEEGRSSSSSDSPPPRPRTERRSSSSPRPAAARSRSRETTGRSSSRPSPRPRPAPSAAASSTPRSSPQPRPAPAAAPVAASAPRSSPQPRPAPAATYVSSPAPAPARSSSPRSERSTPRTYRASSDDDLYRTRGDDDLYRTRSDDDEYSLYEGILRSMRRASSDYRASRNDRDRATSHGESLFGNTVRTLLCPPPLVVSEPVAGLVSPCDTQTKALQDCLHEFETDISKCQLYMNTLYRCKKNSDTKLYDVVRGDRASSDSESRFLKIVRALVCPRNVVVSEVASIAPVAVPVSLCDTQDKTFQDCLHDFETDISKCQLYMNMLSRCKKNSDSKLEA